MLFCRERDFLCVCMPETSLSAKASNSRGFFEEARAGSRSAVARLFSLPTRAIKSLQSPIWFTTPSITSGLLSRISTSKVSRPSSPGHDRAGRRSSAKTTGLLSPKPPSVPRTFWVVRSSDGRWKNCESTSSTKRSFLRSAWRHSGLSSVREKSSFDAPRPGKNATTLSLSLKKTDSQVCKSASLQWPDSLFRRVRSAGDTSPAGAGLLSYGSSQASARNLSPHSRCASLAGVLRCASKEAVGLYAQTKETSGDTRSAETVAKKVSEAPADSSDPGQLLAAPQSGGAAVLPKEQHSYDLDADKCLMAESHRMPVHACQGIRHPRQLLPRPRTTPQIPEQIRPIPQPTDSTKLKLI